VRDGDNCNVDKAPNTLLYYEIFWVFEVRDDMLAFEVCPRPSRGSFCRHIAEYFVVTDVLTSSLLRTRVVVPRDGWCCAIRRRSYFWSCRAPADLDGALQLKKYDRLRTSDDVLRMFGSVEDTEIGDKRLFHPSDLFFAVQVGARLHHFILMRYIRQVRSFSCSMSDASRTCSPLRP
jgi:hypothetical protein